MSVNARDDGGPWARAALVGIVAYVAIDVALVFLRPHFSVLHNAESDYGSNGRYAWLMDLNFVLRCLLSLAVVRALAVTVRQPRLRAALGLLAVWAICSGLLAFFPDDPVGTRTHGLAEVHLALAGIAFVCVLLGTRLATRALRREQHWRPVIVPLTVLSWGALVPVLLLGHAHLRPHTLGGLYEKLFLAVELAWLLVAAAWITASHGAEAAAESTHGRPAGNVLPRSS
ncbi:MAG: DUF998 domain-containing protein [Gaiellaceae bacterium]